MIRYILKPLGAWHLQTGGLEHEQVDPFPRSDTLSAALTHCLVRLYGEQDLSAGPWPFRCSSVFPAIRRQDSHIFLYPKPLSYNPEFPDGFTVSRKILKKIRWVTERVFNLLIRGEEPLLAKLEVVPGSNILALKEEQLAGLSELDKTATRTRVVLDRLTQAAMPFQFSARHAGAAICWHFLSDVEPQFQSRFNACLRLLGDEGIGGDRTIGMGQFWVEEQQEVAFDMDSEQANATVNIGLYNPDNSERLAIRWHESSYDIVNRQGWTTQPVLRRKNVRMVDEGSVLAGKIDLKGRILTVLDPEDPSATVNQRTKLQSLDHKVYRDGQGFFIPFRLNP